MDLTNKDKICAEQVMREVAEGQSYNNRLDHYETVKKNERFYIGDQWNGLKKKNLNVVTMNFLRRVCSYFRSVIMSDDIGFEVRPFRSTEDADLIAKVFETSIDHVFERCKLKSGFRTNLRDAIVDGDCVKYFWFDPTEKSGQAVAGEIRAENLMNTNVLFGNPYSADVQEQPYIILQRRRPVAQVREEAKKDGCAAWESIAPDDGGTFVGEEADGAKLCTENVRFWKRDGRVWHMKVVGRVVTREATETALTLYPIAYMNWEQRKNSYRGISPMTEVIPTQIAVNRLWTAVINHIHSVAFPKLVYDRSKFPNGWDADPTKAVAVNGDVREAVTGVAGGVQLPTQITQILELIVSVTRDFMGANDAALGNIKPDNTSAIVAVQKASSAPLEMNRLHFYQFVEDCIRIIVDLMIAHYGTRRVIVEEQDIGTEIEFDFGAYPLEALALNVEVGQASYWSELIQMQTADALFQKQIFTDAAQYLESMPDDMVPNKAGLIRDIKEKQARDAAMQQQAGAPTAGVPPAGMVGM